MQNIKRVLVVNDCRHYVVNDVKDKQLYMLNFFENNEVDESVRHPLFNKIYKNKSIQSNIRYGIINEDLVLMFSLEEFNKTKNNFK